MARLIRRTTKEVDLYGTTFNEFKNFVMAQFRLAKADLATATSAGTSWTVQGFHNDTCERILASPVASDLATSLTLVNEIKAIYEFHRADTLAHLVADTTNVIAAATATDLATAITLANAIKAGYNAHRTQATIHALNDSTNSIASTNASDQSSLNTLVNEMRTKIPLHLASGPVAKSLRVIPA